MYLKSIDIHGFKSFAEKTTLTFLPQTDGHNSITAIVGPNGSGKSNVSDAIRWVMGEQSMKHLRGKKSHDIIFSGSASKGQMSMASVMMTLDNSDGRVDMDFDDIVIGRRLYRSGESEYIINGNVVRLLDLQLLLAKAQFGEGAYAIIGQGMIDRLLLQSAQERKAFFDEASGIKEFQIKRHQAFLRLRRTTEHIAQADLLLNEISPRLKTLSRQVKKLEQRQELEVTLHELQDQYYATMWQHHQEQIDGLQKDIHQINDQLQEGQKRLETIQVELAALAGASSRQDVFLSLQREYDAIQQKKNELERTRAVLEGKLQTEYVKSGNHQVGWLESKVQELQKQQQQFADQLHGLETQHRDAVEAQQLAEQQRQELHVSRAGYRSEISVLETELLKLKSEQSAFHITGYRAVQAVLEARHSLGHVHGVVAQLGNVAQKYHLALDVAAGGKLASIVVDDAASAQACVRYLREGRYGVATFLPLTKIRSREVPGYVFDILQEPGVHGLAQDLVSFQSSYQDIFSFVFGNTIVVEDFDTAKRIGIGRVRMVTLKGDLFETSGAIKGGHRNSRQHGISFAGGSTADFAANKVEDCREDIEKKQALLEELEQQLQTVQQTSQEKHSAVAVLQEKMHLLQQQKAKADSELASLEQELAIQTMSPEQYGDIMQDIKKQKEDADQAITTVEAELAQAAQAMAQFNDEEEKKKQRVFTLQDTMQQEQAMVNTLVAQKNEKQVLFAKLETKQEDLQHELYQERQTSIHLVLDRGVPVLPIADVEEAQQQIQKLKYKLSLIGGIDEEIVKEYEETKQRHEDLLGQLTDLKKAHADLEKLIAELDAIMKKKRGKAFKQIKKEFARYFEILFNGGKADLVEIYGTETVKDEEEELDEDTPEDDSPFAAAFAKASGKKKKEKKVLKGVDVIACPPGKKIKNIRALSGGERTMTSIALMCAILKTNPSPFVVLDEVEAALDEANTLRVVNIVKELSEHSQFIIITHNRVTMHAADALYGVTMGNDGISHLLSVNLSEATADSE